MSSRAKSQAVPATSCTSSGGGKSSLSSELSMKLAVELRLLVAALDFFSPRNSKPLGARDALDLLEQVVDRLVAVRGDADALAGSIRWTIRRAPVQVLPEPGGPG